MAKISPCFKWTFVFFNTLFAIFGIVIFVLGLVLQKYVEEVNGLYAAITLYVIGSVIFIFAVLGAYGAHKESKCALIVFFILMCLATAGMLRIAIPVAVSRVQIIATVSEYFNTELPLTKDKEQALNPLQAYFHCCGLRNGYKDWKDEVPESCNCVNADEQHDTCERINSNYLLQNIYMNRGLEGRRVWSQPCGPVIVKYLDKILTIMMSVFFCLAALAILGGLMSLSMIIRISAPAQAQLPSLSLSYQPPKYSEVVNY
ncbi:hypothetical protein PHYPO_G00087200 [Pangasianodon hypophthalmus]|uniref:Tetraspanin n=1 Tax=Pangasianodon hypophthalmus TaxID=310915 RepID=A0A5N5LHQ6_PANHP|nr:tetraspanin-8 [Pangasianodon hypophthalmus]KAB5542068.1 hypothetical protein PHYPO_G00087200 [Pangasianodon hypophthalmus]